MIARRSRNNECLNLYGQQVDYMHDASEVNYNRNHNIVLMKRTKLLIADKRFPQNHSLTF